MNSKTLLRDASAQDIQLELIRRTRFNEFDGKKIVARLRKHRKLWLAVLLDRLGLADYEKRDRLPMMSLIKLRDLPHGYWNADTLFILTKNHADAKRIGRIAKKENWDGEIYVYDDQQEIDMALGVGGIKFGLVSIWWD